MKNHPDVTTIDRLEQLRDYMRGVSPGRFNIMETVSDEVVKCHIIDHNIPVVPWVVSRATVWMPSPVGPPTTGSSGFSMGGLTSVGTKRDSPYRGLHNIHPPSTGNNRRRNRCLDCTGEGVSRC